MSGILAQYAQNIAHAANNVQHAYAVKSQVQAEGARASQAALAGVKDSFDKSEQMKLERQRLDSERELAQQKAEEEGKFLKAITLADQVGADGKPIGTAKAMEIVNAQTEQARAQRAANAPQRTSLSDLAVGGVAAVGVGAAKLGKWSWDKTTGAIANYKANKAAQQQAKEQIKQQGVAFAEKYTSGELGKQDISHALANKSILNKPSKTQQTPSQNLDSAIKTAYKATKSPYTLKDPTTKANTGIRKNNGYGFDFSGHDTTTPLLK